MNQSISHISSVSVYYLLWQIKFTIVYIRDDQKLAFLIFPINWPNALYRFWYAPLESFFNIFLHFSIVLATVNCTSTSYSISHIVSFFFLSDIHVGVQLNLGLCREVPQALPNKGNFIPNETKIQDLLVKNEELLITPT